MSVLRWLLRWTVLSTALELAGFTILALVIEHFLGGWWALVFIAFVLFVIAWALDRRRK